MFDAVSRERCGDGIEILRLARPEARNALTVAMARALANALDDIADDRTCRVVVLAAEGPAFCAGLDLKAVSGDEAPQGAAEWMALQEVFAGVILRLRRMPQPVVAAVQGAAAGAGFGIALACDIRVAAPSANFLVGAVKIGLSAGECGISYHLPRAIGAGRAFEIMLTGRGVDAREALEFGLVTAIDDKPQDRAVEIARAIAANSPYAVKHSKQLMWKNLDAPSLDAALELENHVQVVALTTDDFREGATAFALKRAPRFTGR